MERKEAIRSAYRLTGSSSFYDGMMTCSTLPGRLVCRLDYDFSLADKDAAMHSGVIARTIVLDRLVGGIPGGASRRDCHESRLWARYPLLPDAGLRPLV